MMPERERLRWNPAILERGRFVEALVHVPPSGSLSLRYEWSAEGADVFRVEYRGADAPPGSSPLAFGPDSARAMRRALMQMEAPSQFGRGHLEAVDARVSGDPHEQLRYRLWRVNEVAVIEIEVRSKGADPVRAQVIPQEVVPILAAALTDLEVERERILREVGPTR